MQFFYLAATALGAFLVFWVQPLFAKTVLPVLGGAPAVWNTALLFFQVVLLLGYAYVHFSLTWLGPKRQAVVHLAVVALALFFLPFADPGSDPALAGFGPVLWMLGTMAAIIGLPYFAVTATAPLVQSWMSRTRLPGAPDPYRLYAVSNVGSVLALLCFPFVLEPRVGLDSQARMWAAAFLALAVCLLACAALLFRRYREPEEPAPAPAGAAAVAETADAPTAWRRRAHWVAFAFVPSSLLLGVTQFITTDLFVVPLLWLLPLTLYLATFIVAFGRPALATNRWVLIAQALALTAAVFSFHLQIEAFTEFRRFLVHLAAFFLSGVVLHGRLVESRPRIARLTEFYLWIALGGALGASFNVFAAPLLFDSLTEYPVMLVAAALLRPRSARLTGSRWMIADGALIAVLAAALATIFAFGGFVRPIGLFGYSVATYFIVAAAGAALIAQFRPSAMFVCLAALFGAGVLLSDAQVRVAERVRSFFGVYSMSFDNEARLYFRHGPTVHGVQPTRGAERRVPSTYFSVAGPVGQLNAALQRARKIEKVGVAGMGVGALACYALPGQQWTFIEIDPVVADFSAPGGPFTYIRECIAEPEVIVADARIALRDYRGGRFDLLYLDAFTGGSMPLHLLTVEAIALYLERLKPDGIIMVNITNSMLDIEPVLGSIAAHLGLAARVQHHFPPPGNKAPMDIFSIWVALAPPAAGLGELLADPRWRAPRRSPSGRVFSDNASNILDMIVW